MPNRKQVEEYVAESGIFAKDQAAAQLEKAITTRSSYAAAFEKTMSTFADTLAQNDKAQADFYNMLDQTRAAGLVEMVKRHTDTRQYHIAEHAAEVAHDTAMALQKIYTHKFPGDTSKNDIIRHIAIAAAAWHDVVQSKGAPANEIESAKEFEKYFRKELSKFRKKYPDCANAIIELQKYLDFIANELIVYDTWLVFSINTEHKIIAKTLRQHTRMLAPDETPHTPMLERLWLAADTISISDTSRFALEHVRNEKALLSATKQLPQDAQDALNAFFQIAHMHDADAQEAFLGLMGQDIRMFPELNTTEISLISTGDYQHFMNALHQLRRNDEVHTNIDFKKLLDLFMNTLMKKAHQPNIQQEINFAYAIGTALWTRHADDLVKLNVHYASLDDSRKASLGKALFIISTKLQPGRKLLMTDEHFKQAVTHAQCGDLILTFFRLKNKQVAANLGTYQAMLNKSPGLLRRKKHSSQ